MSLIPVKGNDGFYRDSKTNAIVNKNSMEFQKYKANAEKLSKDQERLTNMESDMDQLKNDLNDIKSLLKEFLR